MNRTAFTKPPARLARLARLWLLCLLSCVPLAAHAQTTPAAAAASVGRTPTETVRAFYKALGEKRFREAFAMSIYKPAVEGLSGDEFEELRPDFERIAAAVAPAKVEVTGEQVSGDAATVFVKTLGSDDATAPEPVTLFRDAGGAWIIGDRENEEAVRKSGKEFFFRTRIDTHHTEVEAMMQRILAAQFIYSSQHGGTFADLAGLVRAGLVPQDLLGTDSTGYRFHVTPATDGKSYTAGAEPARYGRTGRLSFYLDQSGLRSKDTGGKPFKPAAK